MEGGVDPQVGLKPQSGQQSELELNIPPFQTEILSQTETVQFKSTFSNLMMTKPAYTKGPSTDHAPYTEPDFSRLAYTKPTSTEIPQPQAPSISDYAPWMDLLVKSTPLVLIWRSLQWSVTRFYSMEDKMDQYQSGFTSQFDYLQQRMDQMEDRLARQHEEMMAYL